MAQHFLEQAKLADFVAHLMTRRPVYAPHRRGRRSFAYEQVADPAAVVLDYPRTLGSVKKFFLPSRETLLEFDLAAETTRNIREGTLHHGRGAVVQILAHKPE